MLISDDDLKAIKEAFDHIDPEEARRVTGGLPELKDDANVLAVVVRRRTKRTSSQGKGVKTNHIQRGLAYCYFINDIVEVSGPHIEEVCLGRQCPYMNGSAQGEGIECLWDDGSDEPFTIDVAPSVLQSMAEKVNKRNGGFT